MADLIPNDLSHLSDDEFNALCPHDGHAPGPEPLSPAAQAVLTAATQRLYCLDPEDVPLSASEHGSAIAAALRAAADQVVPHESPPSGGMRPGGTAALTLDEAQGFQRAATRRRILAIATELENHK